MTFVYTPAPIPGRKADQSEAQYNKMVEAIKKTNRAREFYDAYKDKPIVKPDPFEDLEPAPLGITAPKKEITNYEREMKVYNAKESAYEEALAAYTKFSNGKKLREEEAEIMIKEQIRKAKEQTIPELSPKLPVVLISPPITPQNTPPITPQNTPPSEKALKSLNAKKKRERLETILKNPLPTTNKEFGDAPDVVLEKMSKSNDYLESSNLAAGIAILAVVTVIAIPLIVYELHKK